MQICYKADDGMIFDTEEECRGHEAKNSLAMFAADKPTDNWGLADTVFIKDDEVYFALDHNFREEWGFSGPGWYVWSEYDDRFVCWDDVVWAYTAYKNFIESKMREGYVPEYD